MNAARHLPGVLVLVLGAGMASAADRHRPVIVFDGKATEVAASAPESKDLWVTPADFTRATRLEIKPEGVCAGPLCFPLPERRKGGFLAERSGVTWFNLSAFARLLHQPVATDAKHNVWYFGPRPETQKAYRDTLMAPDFTLPDLNGRPHALSDFRGKKVLLITWASW